MDLRDAVGDSLKRAGFSTSTTITCTGNTPTTSAIGAVSGGGLRHFPCIQEPFKTPNVMKTGQDFSEMPPRKMFRAKRKRRIRFTACFQCSSRCETSVAARKVTKTPFRGSSSLAASSEGAGAMRAADGGGLAFRIGMMEEIGDLVVNG